MDHVLLVGKLKTIGASSHVLKRFASYSRGLRPGSKMCSENISKWQYLSLGNLEQNELFPKSKSEGFLAP